MAGDVVQIPPLPVGQPAAECITVPDHCMVSAPFVVQGDQPFAVASFMVGGTLQMPGTDPTNSQGDPSMTMEVAPKQFRQQYTFLAPVDYQENFADVVFPRAPWCCSMACRSRKLRPPSLAAAGASCARS
ncbi:MAG: hypothetical protein ABI488_06225 [Polyangiaceae bacterium]